MKKGWKAVLVVVMAVCLWLLSGLLFRPEEAEGYILRIGLEQDRTGSQMQLFWWEEGGGPSQEQSRAVPIYGKRADIPLDQEMFLAGTEWRLDPLDSDQEVGLTSAVLYKGKESVIEISPEMLEGYATEYKNVILAAVEKGVYRILPANEDPVLWFGTALGDLIREEAGRAEIQEGRAVTSVMLQRLGFVLYMLGLLLVLYEFLQRPLAERLWNVLRAEKLRLAVIVVLMLLGAGQQWLKAGQYTLQLRLDQGEAGSQAELYWYPEGGTVDASQGSQAVYEGRKAVLPLKKEAFAPGSQWRLDPMNLPGERAILELAVYQGEQKIRAIPMEELEAAMTECGGLNKASVQGDSFVLDVDGSDPMLYLDSSIPEMIRKEWEQEAVKQLVLFFVFVCAVVYGHRLPGIRPLCRRCLDILKQRKYHLAAGAVMVFLAGLYLSPNAEEYSLRIRTAEPLEEGTGIQLYWWGTEGQVSQEQSVEGYYDRTEAVLPLEKGAVGWRKQWRLDPLDREGGLELLSMELYHGVRKVRTFLPEELETYLEHIEGIRSIAKTEQGIRIHTAEEDPIMNFGQGLPAAVRSSMYQGYGVQMGLAVLYIGFLLFLSGYLWRCCRKTPEKKYGRRLLLLLPVLFFWGWITWPDFGEYGIRLTLQEPREEEDYAQIYWWEKGTPASGEQSVQDFYHGNKVYLPLPGESFGHHKEWRLDVVNTKEAAVLTELAFYQGRELVHTYSMEEIRAAIMDTAHVESLAYTDEGLLLQPDPENPDPMCDLGTVLVRDRIRSVWVSYLFGLLAAVVVTLILGCGILQPGFRKIYETAFSMLRENRERVVAWCAMLMICFSVCVPNPLNYSIKIQLSEDRTGDIAELYWWGEDGEAVIEQSHQEHIKGDRISLPFRKGTLESGSWWRIDVTSREEAVEVVSFDLYEGGKYIRSISLEELEQTITGSSGVSRIENSGTSLRIEPDSSDPILYFSDHLSGLILEEVWTAAWIRILLCGIPLAVLLMADRLPVLGRIYRWGRERIRTEWGSWLGFGLLLTGMILVLFYDFWTGEKLFLYQGDSFYQTFPQLTRLADRIQAGEWGWTYTFFESLGNEEEPIYLSMKNWPALFGREHLAYMMGISQMLKVFLAGIFCYGYLRQMGTGKLGCVLIGLGYSCSAYVIARGMWQNYPNEAVCFMLWLWGFEHFKKTKKWLPFLLANIFSCWHYHGYTIVLYTGIGLVYGIFRLISDQARISDQDRISDQARISDQETEKSSDRNAGSWRQAFSPELGKQILSLAGLMAAGLIVTAAAWLPSLRQMLGSSRITEGAEVAGNWKNILNYTRLKGYRTLFYRTLVPDGVGMYESDYYGVTNWLEDPVFYCGLLTLITAPLGLAAMEKRKRRWYMLPLAGAAAYIMFGIVRNVANGFAGIGWKLSSLWLLILLVLFAASFWKEQGEWHAESAGKGLVFVNAAILLLAAALHHFSVKTVYVGTALIFGLFLSWITYRMIREKEEGKKQYLQYLLIAAVSMEVAGASYRTLHNQSVVYAETLEQNQHYEDATGELLETVKAEDEFYRVDKQFASVSYCDSLYQQFPGISSYIGGVGDNEYTQKLYHALGLSVMDHIQKGSDQHAVVNALLNVRYVLTSHQEVNTYGLQEVREQDGITLYESEHTLPFGYVYDSYMTEEDFETYNHVDRRNLMLERCVISGEETDLLDGKLTERSYYRGYSDRWKKYRRPVSTQGNDVYFTPLQEGEVAVLRILVEAEEDAFGDASYMRSDSVLGKVDISLSKGVNSRYMEFLVEGVDRVSITASTSKPYDLTAAKLYVIPQELYYKTLKTETEEQSRGGLEITHCSSRKIEGSTTLDRDGIMVFSIPYDEDWSIWVDGEPAQLLHANIGFMGVCLSKGEHEIVLQYRGTEK